MSLAEYAERWVDMAPHIGTLTRLARRSHGIVEFGIRGGVSTWAFLDGLPADGWLVGYDMDLDVPSMLPPRVIEDPRFRLVLEDDIQAKMPAQADLVMIDSSHEYYHTIAELGLAASMRPRRILLHDYNDPPHPGVGRAVDEFVKGHPYDAPPYRLQRVEASQWGLAILVPR